MVQAVAASTPKPLARMDVNIRIPPWNFENVPALADRFGTSLSLSMPGCSRCRRKGTDEVREEMAPERLRRRRPFPSQNFAEISAGTRPSNDMNHIARSRTARASYPSAPATSRAHRQPREATDIIDAAAWSATSTSRQKGRYGDVSLPRQRPARNGHPHRNLIRITPGSLAAHRSRRR
jgi:hypothetical protein